MVEPGGARGWCLLAACATAETPTGAGGDSTSTSSTSAGGSTSAVTSSHAATTGTYSPSLCGNGILDPGEDCDGLEYDGKDCASFGLGPGMLLCNEFCSFYLASCSQIERCDDGFDNDIDGKTDCDDSDCQAAATCADSCTPAKVLGLPDLVTSTTGAAPRRTRALAPRPAGARRCSSSPRSPPARSRSSSAPRARSPSRSRCAPRAPTTPARSPAPAPCSSACPAAPRAGDRRGRGGDLLRDGRHPRRHDGSFDLSVAPWHPETACNNLVDDDSDGYLDCDDPDCQTRPECASGPGATGSPCGTPTDCSANHADPICLPLSEGFPAATAWSSATSPPRTAPETASAPISVSRSTESASTAASPTATAGPATSARTRATRRRVCLGAGDQLR